ncbi:hypothetical protein BGY98DRAFT_909217 [Russula aff. rugulosa BPL654]|nr:hypothetical protein BGY98DRAFT_909217 [Russula aff. rugulosa BPL654]
MAVLVTQDWHLHKDHAMDSPASNTSNSSVPRQRVSPPNDPSSAPSGAAAPQNHYPYPVQQQQAGWNAHAQPFYPAAFYQNAHQQPYPMHPSQQGQVPPHGPFFDPNAQFAQWAYQQMMFNAQQQAHQLSQHGPPSSSQRGRSSSTNSPSPADFFAHNQLHNFSPFPSGTPPPHPSQLPNGYRSGSTSNGSTSSATATYDGFHPYRRPNHRQATQPSSDQPATGDWRQQAIQPPYTRPDAAGSTTSVNSTASASRQRTSSLQGSSNGTSGSPHHHTGNNGAAGSVRSRNGPSPQQQAHPSSGSAGRSGGNLPARSSSPSPSSARPHHRNPSSSSSTSSSVTRTSQSGSSVLHAPTPRPARPSPLSQGISTAEKRMSRDDSELIETLPNSAAIRSGGLKGKIRRVLSLSTPQAIAEEESSATPSSSSQLASRAAGLQSNAADAGDAASTATKQAKKKRTALFNSRLNASTDNISLSSTMSSASVVIRKLGSIGKLARRNSLAGITSLFKDKKDNDDTGESDGKKGKKKKGGKGEAAEASVSHVTAELDRPSSEWSAELNGLSPAAKLARQHTLKSNAEAAARAKAQEEAAVAAAAVADTATATASSSGDGSQAAGSVPTTWEKNTTTNRGTPGTIRTNEDGMRVVVEEDDSGSEGESEHPHDYSAHIDGWEDEDWSHIDDDEDVTIRQGLERTSLGEEEGDDEPWAIGIRRSLERTLQPSKGILKNADGYDQHRFIDTPTSYSRHRSNSYNSHPAKAHELGPLARIPSPNPDHIDGLRHPTASSGAPVFLPALSFEEDEGTRPSSERTLFNHPNLNSSAPVLSTALSPPPTLAHRSATSPAKRLAFANNLSVYDTFPPSVYDRRSEPATWSRLTPALAQRIKEELNSFKMEEMEVHAASRIQYAFLLEPVLQSADVFAVLQYPVLCLTLLSSSYFFSANALLFVHDLSRPHSHACYPDSAYIRANPCSVRYTLTHYHPAQSLPPLFNPRFTPSHIPRPL